MKGLILASAMLFAVVSAAPKLSDIETETMMLECMLDNYGKDPRDMSLDHNETQIMSCFFHCDLSLGGAIYEDGTLNVPFLEEIMADKIATSDFPVLEFFIKVYYECKRDYPDHCDWFICVNRKWPQSGEKGILDEMFEEPKTLKNDKEYKSLGRRIPEKLTTKNIHSSLKKIK